MKDNHSKGFRVLQKQGLATTQPDTSTLGDASFYQWHFYFFRGIDEPAVSVSFVLKLNNGMGEMPTAAQLKGKRKMEHRKAYERLAGLRPSALKAYLIKPDNNDMQTSANTSFNPWCLPH